MAAAVAAACSSADGHENQTSCGDGSIGGTEQCDDGNTTSGDGCSATCAVEASASCGDGAVASSEGCDDGNMADGDGCNATCAVEDGYTCTGAPSMCTNGSTASGTCAAPFALALTDNMGVLEGIAMGDTTMSTDQVPQASCDGFPSGAGPDHIWAFTLPDTRDVYILTDEGSAFDTVIRLMSAPCDVSTELTEFGTADGCSDGEGATEFLGYVRLPAGTYYVVLDGYEATDLGAYTFTVEARPTECGNGVVDLLEFCDDGATASADGCDDKCEVEDGYTCDGEPSVCVVDTSSAVPPAVGDLVLNEFMAADNASDTNCDSSTSDTADEFVELVNVSTKTLDMTGVTIADSVVMRHTFGAIELAPGAAVVVWNAGAPACPNITTFEVASSGQLGLNDGGDTIKVELGTTMLISHTYTAQTANVSANLSPELTGTSYTLHNMMSGAMGSFSPGRRSDGSAF